MHKISFAVATLGVAVSLASRSADAQVNVSGTASGSVGTPPPVTPAPAAPPVAAAPAPAAAPPAALDVPPPGDAPLAAAGEPGEENPDAVWAERDRAVNEQSTLTGGVGLLHMQHAQGNAPGQFNVSFTTEYFSANFLCTPSFPCPNPNGGTTNITSDSLSHIGGSVQLSATVAKWLEMYGGTSAFANSDTANHPSLLQVLGDTNLGFKAFGKIGKVFHVGGAGELWLINGTGSVGLAGGGTSAKFRGLASVDLRDSDKQTPLRFSINMTYSLDNTGAVVQAVEAARGAPITRIERYGLGIDRVDHFDIGIGAEAFFVQEKIRPFIEYNIQVPVNRQSYACPEVNPSGDNCLANDSLAPSKLTIGGRFFPWKRGFAVTAAFDIGITGMNDFIEEMSPVPPWTFYLGVGWGIDTWDRPVKSETKIVEHVLGIPEGHIKGYVQEAGKPEVGVPNAIVAFANHSDISSLATGPDGKFVTLGLPVGKYDLAVKADGYRDGVCSVSLVEATAVTVEPPTVKDGVQPPVTAPIGSSGGKTTIPDVNVTCTLEALPRVGKVVGHVRDAESKQPVANATIKLTDHGGHEFTQASDSNGAFHFDGLAPGEYQATASADLYMNDVETVEVKPRQDASAEIVMVHRPAKPLVTVSGKEIIIKQQVQFATDSAVILPASNALLTEVADVFSRNTRIHSVEIQGHTDSDGDDAHNQMLSEDRANAVRTWLVSHGVDGSRLTAKGYGEKKPLVPNVTAGNRARNRRVQFIIVDQDPAAPKAGAAGGKTK
jgi:outer membrane protein OmpA-like peptidoglycan-associated protein